MFWLFSENKKNENKKINICKYLIFSILSIMVFLGFENIIYQAIMLPDFVFLQDLIFLCFSIRVTNITYCDRLDHFHGQPWKEG